MLVRTTTKICSIQPSKFYKDSPFVSHFPNEFKKVSLEAISSKIGAKGKEARFLFDGGVHRGARCFIKLCFKKKNLS